MEDSVIEANHNGVVLKDWWGQTHEYPPIGRVDSTGKIVSYEYLVDLPVVELEDRWTYKGESPRRSTKRRRE